MGLFDAVKQALKGTAQQAVESAVESAKASITSSTTGAAQGVVGEALGHLGNVPGGQLAADAVQAGANSAIQGTVGGAAEAAQEHMPGQGEGQ